jgi:protein translocase SecG subunit
METVLIVIHLMVVLALVGVVLLQRSEGGGLGMGGSPSGNRGSASTPKVVRESLQFVLRSPSDEQFSSLKREASSGFSRYSGGCSNNNNLFHH